jgi:hypothetical protein
VRFFIKEDSLHDAGAHAFLTADALVRLKQHAAAFPFDQSAAGAGFHAGRITTRDADNGDKTARDAAGRLDLDRALGQGVLLAVDDRADIHTGEAADALVHLSCPEGLRHTIQLTSVNVLGCSSL